MIYNIKTEIKVQKFSNEKKIPKRNIYWTAMITKLLDYTQ